MSRFQLLSIEDDFEEPQQDEQVITPHPLHVEVHTDSNSNALDADFEQVKKNTRKSNKKKLSNKPVSRRISLPGWQSFNSHLLVYLLWNFALTRDTFFSIYRNCSTVCVHWNEVMSSSDFWKKGAELWSYGTKEQRDWIFRQPSDQHAKYWMKLFKAHLHEEINLQWKIRSGVNRNNYFVNGEVGPDDSKDIRRKKKFWADCI